MVLTRGMLNTTITLVNDHYKIEFYSSNYDIHKEDDGAWVFEAVFNVVDDLDALNDKVGDLANVSIEPFCGVISSRRPAYYGSVVIEDVVADTKWSDLAVRLVFVDKPVRKTS